MASKPSPSVPSRPAPSKTRDVGGRKVPVYTKKAAPGSRRAGVPGNPNRKG